MREYSRIDNLQDTAETVEEFTDILKKRKPDVIVIGGFSMTTLKLTHRIKEILKGGEIPVQRGLPVNGQAFDIPVIYVFDDVARIYQHSNRAVGEFSAIPPMGKYCVGLARYAQSPLNEFAALGSDIAAITLDDEDQHLVGIPPSNFFSFLTQLLQVPREKLLTAFERVLVDVTNKVGVDINRAVADSYYHHLLPFVCGLGPRKAQDLVKKIGALVSASVNHELVTKPKRNDREAVWRTETNSSKAGYLRPRYS
jgi:transcription elongation factor SPT6